MDPNTVAIILFAEQLAELAAKTLADMRAVAAGASSQTTAQLLDDADSKYDAIIASAKAAQLPA